MDVGFPGSQSVTNMAKSFLRACERCDEKFKVYPSAPNRRFCSAECRKNPSLDSVCENCRKPYKYKPGRNRGLFCKDSCRIAWFSQNFQGENSPHWKGGIRAGFYSKRRRAVYRKGENINHLEVFEYHNWICNICGQDIDPGVRFPDKRAASLEHIIPISKGGQHVWDNVAPAHIECNNKKGNKLPGNIDVP